MRLLTRSGKPAMSVTEDPASSAAAIEVAESSPLSLLPDPGSDVTGPTKVRKETMISRDICLTGSLEGEGNITIEGRVEGNIRCTHQVRVVSGGQVTGDIFSRQVTVNGRVEGRIDAGTVHLQAEGEIEGDILADELMIEKGGRFTGQSRVKPHPEEHEASASVTALILHREEIVQAHRVAEKERKIPESTSKQISTAGTEEKVAP